MHHLHRILLFLFAILAWLTLTVAAHAELLDADRFDASGCGFNATPGTYLTDSFVIADVYTDAGTNAFESPAAAGIPAPAGGSECIARIQWSIDGQDELQPLTVAGFDVGPLQEFYFEYDFYYPTGFKWCGGKVFRAGRQVSGNWVGDWMTWEGEGGFGSTTGVPNLFVGTFATAKSPSESDTFVHRPFGPRDQWFKVGVWAKWNTYDGSTPVADGFLRFYIDDVEVAGASQSDKVWSTDSADAGGFTTFTAPLNMSYASCEGTDTDGAVWTANVRLYDTKPVIPPFDIGFNYRRTEGCDGHADDAANHQFVDSTDEYPKEYDINGLAVTAGYESGTNIERGSDFCEYVTAKELGGSHKHNPAWEEQVTYRIDLPSPGQYEVCAALGDRFFYTGTEFDLVLAIRDDTTEVHSVEVSPNVRTSSNTWYDLDGIVHAQADWRDNQTCKTLTFTSQVLRFDLCDGTNRECQSISHLSIKYLGQAASSIRRAYRNAVGRRTSIERFNR